MLTHFFLKRFGFIMLFVCGFVGQGAGGETSGSDTGGGETALGAGERLKLE